MKSRQSKLVMCITFIIVCACVYGLFIKYNWMLFAHLPRPTARYSEAILKAREVAKELGIEFDSFSKASSVYAPYLTRSEVTSSIIIPNATSVMVVRTTMSGTVNGAGKGFLSHIYFNIDAGKSPTSMILNEEEHKITQQTFLPGREFAAPSFTERNRLRTSSQDVENLFDHRLYLNVWKPEKQWQQIAPIASPLPLMQIDLYSGGDWTGSVCIYPSDTESHASNLNGSLEISQLTWSMKSHS